MTVLRIEVLKSERGARPGRILHLQCDSCRKPYTKKFNQITAGHAKHYCCLRCMGVDRRTNPEVERVRHLICKKCGRPFSRTFNTDYDSENACCSKSCASSLNAVSHNSAAYMNTPEVKARAKKSLEALREKWRTGQLPDPRIGRHWSICPEARLRMSLSRRGIRNAFFGKHHSIASRLKMSEARSRLIVAGRMNWSLFGRKSGDHTSTKVGKTFHFRSSWEEAAMKWLDASDVIQAWDYECVRIPYYYQNHKRWYIPDFVVTYTDGHGEMWEIKPHAFLQAEAVVLKAAAATEYCAANSLVYRTLDRDQLKSLQIL